MIYSDKVMEHFTHPRNMGELKNPDGMGRVGNPKCGDIMEIQVKVKNEVITDIKFKTFGCAAAIASTSMLTEMVKGKTINEALNISKQLIVEKLGGLPKPKIHCSLLATDALKKAIDDYKSKNKK